VSSPSGFFATPEWQSSSFFAGKILLHLQQQPALLIQIGPALRHHQGTLRSFRS